MDPLKIQMPTSDSVDEKKKSFLESKDRFLSMITSLATRLEGINDFSGEERLNFLRDFNALKDYYNKFDQASYNYFEAKDLLTHPEEAENYNKKIDDASKWSPPTSDSDPTN